MTEGVSLALNAPRAGTGQRGARWTTWEIACSIELALAMIRVRKGLVRAGFLRAWTVLLSPARASRPHIRSYVAMTPPTFFHVDVFATSPMTGNGLAVFLDTADWSTSVMQRMTREMRQFESIFLSDCSASGAAARVFTVDEELPFAGHPVLGAAAVLHRTQAPNSRRLRVDAATSLRSSPGHHAPTG